MIKSELVQRISDRSPHLYQRDVEKIVSAILDEIVDALVRGDRVELRGFGYFRSSNAGLARAATHEQGGTFTLTRSAFRPSRPARKCASA